MTVARTSQLVAEVLRTNGAVTARVGQVAVEVVRNRTGLIARVGQVAVEVLRPNVQEPLPPPQLDPTDWIDNDDPVELYTFTVPGTSQVWRYCTDSAVYTHDGATFIPEAITRTEVTRTIGELSSDLTITAGDQNPFTLQMLAGLSARPVDVLVQRVQRDGSGVITVFTGKATSVSLDGPQASIACVPRGAVASKRKIPWQTFQSTCNHQLFSEGCTLDRDAFVRGPYTLAASAHVGAELTITGTHANGDLSNGYVERVLDGDRRFIEQNVGALLTLQGSFPNVADGEQWNVYPGCRRTEADCTTRFNNLVHFLGWERLPALNPFARSAFYLAGPAPTAPPVGTTADLGGGYTLTLVPATTLVRVEGSYSTVPAITVSLTAGTDGFLRFSGNPLGSSYISPRPSPASVVSDLDIWFTDPGDPDPPSLVAPSYVRLVPTTGYGVWAPLTSAASANFSLERVVQSGASGAYLVDRYADRTVQVRVRRRSTGIVLAEGAMTVRVVALMPSNSNGG